LTEFNDLLLSDFGNACFVPGFRPTVVAPGHGSSRAPSPAGARPTDAAAAATHAFLEVPAGRERVGGAARSASTPVQLPGAACPEGSPTSAESMSTGLPLLPLDAPAGPESLDGGSVAGDASPTVTASTVVAATGGGGGGDGNGGAVLSSASSLRDGLGRGTQAYSAPELFEWSSGSGGGGGDGDGGTYSFPVDIYSVGVTLHVAATGAEPFALSRGAVHMLMAIRRGYWASGLQVGGVGPDGPDVGDGLGDDEPANNDVAAATAGGARWSTASTADADASAADGEPGESRGRGSTVMRGLVQAGSGLEGNRWVWGASPSSSEAGGSGGGGGSGGSSSSSTGGEGGGGGGPAGSPPWWAARTPPTGSRSASVASSSAGAAAASASGGRRGSRAGQTTRSRALGGGNKVKFPGGEPLHDELVRIVCACVERDPAVRPTARELLVWLTSVSLAGLL
ncbi:hypothetical protein HK405_015685, partial [Cladochytrium tenue]